MGPVKLTLARTVVNKVGTKHGVVPLRMSSSSPGGLYVVAREKIQTYTPTQHKKTEAGSQGLTNVGRVTYVLVNFPTW